MPIAAAERETVQFQINQTTTFGTSVFVLGDIPELGGNDPTRSVKLEPGAYPIWRVAVSIPKGTSFTYRYALRSDSISSLSNPANYSPIGSLLNGMTGPANPVPASKSFFYHSGWEPPTLHWRPVGGAFSTRTMRRIAAGRGPGEWRWHAGGFGVGGRSFEFHFEGGSGGRDPASGEYRTALDAAFVQDGQLFDYLPPAAVSLPQQTNFGTFFSPTLGENRPYRVVVPRGYAQNTTRRYPVLYLHDGQNVFDFGPFGTWNADESAASLIAAGRLREIILVGVDNTANRFINYTPPDDVISGNPGQADDYAAFLINELKPVIDANYRTRPQRDYTGTLGSSLGGLVSLYLGWDFTATFSRVGPMSGSWQLANFPNRVRTGPKRDIRIYMDSGDSGASQDNAWPCLDLRDGLLRLGYALEGDLRHTIGYGHQHNEAAWAARFPGAVEFLFPAHENENELLSVPTRPIGDIDDDGDVDGDDTALLALALVGAPADPAHGARADIDGSGIADGRDVAAFVELAWVNMLP